MSLVKVGGYFGPRRHQTGIILLRENKLADATKTIIKNNKQLSQLWRRCFKPVSAQPACPPPQSSTHTAPGTHASARALSPLPDRTSPRRPPGPGDSPRQRSTAARLPAPRSPLTADLASRSSADMGDMGDPPKSKPRAGPGRASPGPGLMAFRLLGPQTVFLIQSIYKKNKS